MAEAIEWLRTTVKAEFLRLGCVNGVPRFGLVTKTSDKVPGGAYSGWPGSRSSITTLRAPCFWDRSVNRPFRNSREKVDFPADLGPHINVDSEGFFRLVATSEDNFLFHSGGETSFWMMHFLGASSEVYI